MAFKNKKKDEKKSGKISSKKDEKQQDRNFVGGGWNNTKDNGVFLNIQINKDKLGEIEEDKYGNIRLTIAERKEADEKSGMDLMVYESIPYKKED